MSSVKRNFAGNGDFYVGSGSVTTSALAAAGEEDLTISDTNVALGDIVFAAFDKAGAEDTGEPIIAKAWVSATGTITVTVANLHASAALDAQAQTVNYIVIRP